MGKQAISVTRVGGEEASEITQASVLERHSLVGTALANSANMGKEWFYVQHREGVKYYE
jgi:hypothetical protein